TSDIVTGIFERASTNSNVVIQFKDATTSWYLGKGSDNNFSINTNNNLGGGTLFNLTPAGNLGLGVITPTEKLEVVGNVKATSFIKSGSSNNDILLGGGGTKLLAELVTTNTVQAITGIKTFHNSTGNSGAGHHPIV